MNVYLVFVEDCTSDVTVPAVFKSKKDADKEAKRLAEETLDTYKVEEISNISEEFVADWEFESRLSTCAGSYEVINGDGTEMTSIWVEMREVQKEKKTTHVTKLNPCICGRKQITTVVGYKGDYAKSYCKKCNRTARVNNFRHKLTRPEVEEEARKMWNDMNRKEK